MLMTSNEYVPVETHLLQSYNLQREVRVDCYLPIPMQTTGETTLLLINDGQDLQTMNFKFILEQFYREGGNSNLLCAAMHCLADRRNEYATANMLDYKGRGTKAAQHARFVMDEVIPFIKSTYKIDSFKETAFAGFSLGGLSALDIVWSNPTAFTHAAIFSGSFWWRDKAQEDPTFNEDTNRIMHRKIREGGFYPWLKFFFEVGTLDETADRNNNGIIDAIDDTISLIDELKNKGYSNEAIRYLELQDGQHNVETWARAFPAFLGWAWGTK